MSDASREHGGPEQIRSGIRVDRYDVQEYLGRFSMGATYRGYDRSSASSVRIVALEGVTSPEARKRLATEMPKVVALRHPHVLRVIGFGTHGDEPYLVTDYVAAGSVADLMERRALDRGESIRVLGGIAGAVDQAHRSGIVHGDLRPSNVLIDPDGAPLVFGFGIASLEAGTVPSEFLAPEEASTGNASAAADRYSFAVIAYEVLTGDKPSFGRPSGSAPDADLTLRPSAQLGPATYEVLRRGLALQPQRRWATCTEMSEALADAVRKDAAPAPAETPKPRNWTSVLLAVVLVLVLGILAAVLWNQTHQTTTPGITLSDSTVQQGGSLIVNGSKLPPNQVGTVQLESAPQQIGAFQADQNGNTTARVTVPDTTTPGDHVVSLCWDTCHASAKLTVTERTPTPSASPTPTPTPSPSPTPSASPSPSPKTAPSGSPSGSPSGP